MHVLIKMSFLRVIAIVIVGIIVFAACKKNKNAPTPKPTPVTSITIGQFYAGGIVFHIDTSGRHGLVCSPVDQSQAIRWSTDTLVILPLGTFSTDDSLGAGEANTKKIVAILGPGSYAAYLCDTLTLNGYDDWFLPSFYELDTMFLNLATKGFGGLDYGKAYCSSTHCGGFMTHSGTITNWVYGFYYDTSFIGSAKGVNLDAFYDYSLWHVRAIRAF